jgi:hypothetical protein
VNSRRWNLRISARRIIPTPEGVDRGDGPAPPGPGILFYPPTPVGFAYGFSLCCPPGNKQKSTQVKTGLRGTALGAHVLLQG